MVAHTAQVDWPAIQEAYQNGTTCYELAKTHEVSEAAILKRARKEAWGHENQSEGEGYWLGRVDLETDTAQWTNGSDARAIQLNGHAAKCTPENAAAILNMITEGATPAIAAGAVGVSTTAFNRWCDNDQRFNELVEECVYGNLKRYEANLDRTASKGDYKASLAVLRANKRSRDFWRDPDESRNQGITVNISLRSGDDKPSMVDITPTQRQLDD